MESCPCYKGLLEQCRGSPVTKLAAVEAATCFTLPTCTLEIKCPVMRVNTTLCCSAAIDSSKNCMKVVAAAAGNIASVHLQFLHSLLMHLKVRAGQPWQNLWGCLPGPGVAKAMPGLPQLSLFELGSLYVVSLCRGLALGKSTIAEALQP